MSGITSVSKNRARADDDGEHVRYERQVTTDNKDKKKKTKNSASEETLKASGEVSEDPSEKLEYGKASYT